MAGPSSASSDVPQLGPSATRGRLAVLTAVRAMMPIAVYAALASVVSVGDRTRIATLLTAQVAFGFAALAFAAGRRANVAATAAWTAIIADVVVLGALTYETGGIGGPLPFLFGVEALAVGMLFSAADGVRVAFGGIVAVGLVESIRPSASPAGIEAVAGVFAVTAIGLALAALNQREARRRSLELASIRRIAMEIQHSLSLEEILGDLCRGVVGDLRFSAAAVLLPGRDGELVCAGRSGSASKTESPISVRGGIAEAIRTGHIVIVTAEQARANRELETLIGDRGFIALPMGTEGLLVVTRNPSGPGILGRKTWGRVRAHELDPLLSLAQQAALAVANARLHASVAALAVTDPLTQLPNHGEFQRALALECERQRRYSPRHIEGNHASVLLVDIDRFKDINDRFGHPAGDVVLRAVAAALRGAVRSFDLVARYGGEEFGVVLPETDEEGAIRVAERAREAVASATHAIGDRAVRVTISVGVATAPYDGIAPAQLVEAADAALYRSKASGRNTVTHAASLHRRVPTLHRRRLLRSA